jgi:hypothetical protein
VKDVSTFLLQFFIRIEQRMLRIKEVAPEFDVQRPVGSVGHFHRLQVQEELIAHFPFIVQEPDFGQPWIIPGGSVKLVPSFLNAMLSHSSFECFSSVQNLFCFFVVLDRTVAADFCPSCALQ